MAIKNKNNNTLKEAKNLRCKKNHITFIKKKNFFSIKTEVNSLTH